MATSEGRSIIFISVPGVSLNWERLVLFPTMDKERVIVATPAEPIIRMVEDQDAEEIKASLNNFLTEAILLAEQHFESID